MPVSLEDALRAFLSFLSRYATWPFRPASRYLFIESGGQNPCRLSRMRRPVPDTVPSTPGMTRPASRKALGPWPPRSSAICTRRRASARLLERTRARFTRHERSLRWRSELANSARRPWPTSAWETLYAMENWELAEHTPTRFLCTEVRSSATHGAGVSAGVTNSPYLRWTVSTNDSINLYRRPG